MPNHVLRDRIWESKKLAQCSRDAALAYPWIFLVADDHGRFEFNPRRIWSRAFGLRQDITLKQVTTWLDEYQRVGLLVRYHLEGDLAHWTGFKGRPASQRRESLYPDPQGLTAFLPTPEPRGSLGEPFLDQIRDRDRAESESERTPAYPLPPDVRAETAIREARWRDERAIYAAVDAIARGTGKDPGEVMEQVTAYKRRDGSVAPGRRRPELLRSDEAVRKSLEDAKAWLADLEAKREAGRG